MRIPFMLAALFAALSFAGCSSQQAYGAGQAWQRNECFKINDTQERNRCLASTSASYEDYQRKADAAKKAP